MLIEADGQPVTTGDLVEAIYPRDPWLSRHWRQTRWAAERWAERASSCIIDGEAVACGEDGIACFELLLVRWDADGSVFLYAFDLIELDGDDLRHYYWKPPAAPSRLRPGPI
jgi:hypothetical protein